MELADIAAEYTGLSVIAVRGLAICVVLILTIAYFLVSYYLMTRFGGCGPVETKRDRERKESKRRLKLARRERRRQAFRKKMPLRK